MKKIFLLSILIIPIFLSAQEPDSVLIKHNRIVIHLFNQPRIIGHDAILTEDSIFYRVRHTQFQTQRSYENVREIRTFYGNNFGGGIGLGLGFGVGYTIAEIIRVNRSPFLQFRDDAFFRYVKFNAICAGIGGIIGLLIPKQKTLFKGTLEPQLSYHLKILPYADNNNTGISLVLAF